MTIPIRFPFCFPSVRDLSRPSMTPPDHRPIRQGLPPAAPGAAVSCAAPQTASPAPRACCGGGGDRTDQEVETGPPWRSFAALPRKKELHSGQPSQLQRTSSPWPTRPALVCTPRILKNGGSS
ncbi:hypothetical protein SETIT_9G482000v2 [Setaria italica]|uniref:Uncharacterized protein n=1 Tax=Setaria italica TaxID=4555 RepID=A0A368STP8_SETIT|nr:hypothetical protein SETIT_9G482000v2 [Setaria italica]